MRHKQSESALPKLAEALGAKLRAPLAIILGSPREVVELAGFLQGRDVTCYQMDLFQARRTRAELAARGLPAVVRTSPDLWDLEPSFQTAIFPAPEGGERSLKIDMIEQASHVLALNGTLAVATHLGKDQYVAGVVKKVFRECRVPAAGEGAIFYAHRRGEHPRRRHEVTFQVREGDVSLRFISRPGTFSYGRFDNGARALTEAMHIEPGSRVIDIGCGCGTNGVIAGKRGAGFIVFVDSNLRAVQLAELNARANSVVNFKAVASDEVAGFPETEFDIALANPPYYAQLSIARLFIERAHALLRATGRLYLVTKQAHDVGEMIAELFGAADVETVRGYTIFVATK